MTLIYSPNLYDRKEILDNTDQDILFLHNEENTVRLSLQFEEKQFRLWFPMENNYGLLEDQDIRPEVIQTYNCINEFISTLKSWKRMDSTIMESLSIA